MSELSCTVQSLQDAQADALTVGERFALSCQGTELGEIEPKSAHFKFEEIDKYKLELLKIEKASASEIRLQVVSDLVGEHDLKNLLLIDDAGHSLTLGQVKFSVKSVQDPKAPVQEPYGMVGPFQLSIPWIYWIFLLALFAVIGALIAWRLLIKRQRRKLMDRVLALATPLAPGTELFQALRKFQRHSSFLLHPEALVEGQDAVTSTATLDQAYRLFLSRSFVLPAIDWDTAKTLRVIQKENKHLSEKSLIEVRRILRELDKAKSARLQAKDYLQLVEWIRESASRIEKENQELT